jgi:L-iditol 2-dehydrogenase/threonine 3-dehydrogenase
MDNLVDNIEKGGEIIVAGVFGEPPRINMAFVGEHELKIIGTMMYKHEDYEEAVKNIASGKIITEPLVTKHFSFGEYHDAYQYIDAKGDRTMKVMIDVQ